ncbi:MAG: MBL fold metallo-hydrolase [Syntrophales bacterium]|nr:MBL fold metallo-hydrolase [Syntrophales bacterium]
MRVTLKPAKKIEILTLQDNYIEMTAFDSNEIITRASPLKEGKIGASILAEHGLSLLIKVSHDALSGTILFDFGFSEHGAAQNAATLEAELNQIEIAALSHGHSDHTGGMKALGKMIGKEIPLVLHPAAFKAPRYLKMGRGEKINFPPMTKEGIKKSGFIPLEMRDPFLIAKDMVLFLGEIPRRTDFEQGFPIAFWEDKGTEKQDLLEDDTSVVVNLEHKGLVVISGCAHAGIINTVLYAIETTGIEKIHAIIGGFHLSGPFFEPIINRTIEELTKLDPDYIIPMHCTGRKAIMAIERALAKKFLLNMAGTKMTFI